jgi:hypothetical protein
MAESQLLLAFFQYPTNNDIFATCRLEPRQVIIHRKRDLWLEPLSPISIERRPKKRRDRFLHYGLDYDKQAKRKYYEGSMRKLRYSDQPLLRLGIYSTTFPDMQPALFGRVYLDTRKDQEEVKNYLREINRNMWLLGQGRAVALFPLTPENLRRVSA